MIRDVLWKALFGFLSMRSGVLPALLLSVLFLAVGCGGGEPEDSVYVGPKSAKLAVDEMKETFDRGDSPHKERATRLWQAMRDNDVETAAREVMILRNAPTENMDEAMAVHHTYMTLQDQIARDAERGDPQAIAALNFLRGRRD